MKFSCTPMPWDSKMMGHTVSRLEGLEYLSPPLMEQQFEACFHGHPARLLVTKVHSEAPHVCKVVNLLQERGAHSVGVECTLALQNIPPPLHIPGVRVTLESSCDPLPFLELADTMRHSRYMRDPHIPYPLAHKIWVESLTNHCTGLSDAIALVRHEGNPAGLATLHFNKDVVRIGIVGIILAYQRQGLGRALMSFVANRFGRGWCPEVETFEDNTAAMTLYQQCGFMVQSRTHVFHVWSAASL